MRVEARPATTADIDEIVRLRRVLFEAIHGDRATAIVRDTRWEANCAAVVRTSMDEGRLVAAVVDDAHGRGLASVGTAEIHRRLPGPSNPTGLLGYIGTMVTTEEHRGHGMATAILRHLVDELHRRGVARIELHATPVAEGLYRAAGFAPRPGGLEMRLQEP